MQPFEHRSVRYWSKEINGTRTGGRKMFFLIREIDVPTMAAASMESCRFVALMSPWGRVGSVLVTCKRLRRMRRRFHQGIHISQVHGTPRPFQYKSPKF